jgi:hypothetical protein
MPNMRVWSMSFPAALLIAALAGPGCGPLEDLAQDVLSHHPGGGDAGTQCSYGGKAYPIGASFPSQDGCNVCSCEAMGVACTTKACGGSGGETGMPPGPTCDKLMVPGASGCTSLDSLKQAATQICADRMEILTGLEPNGLCPDGLSAQAAIAECCAPQPPDAQISCSPGMQASGVPCTVCVDATGAIVKTDCAR